MEWAFNSLYDSEPPAQFLELINHVLGFVNPLVKLAGLTPFCSVVDINAPTLGK